MSIRPVQYNIYIEKGRDFTQRFYIQDGSGNAIDLTGWTVASQLRPTYGSEILLAEFDTTMSGSAGWLEISLTASGTNLIETENEINLGSSVSSTNAVYDIMLTDTLGKKYNYVKGTATIEGTSTTIA